MRLIQATVPPSILSDVKRILEDQGIDYFASEETGTDKYAVVLYISIPEELVESLLEDLYRSGLDASDHVVIIDTEVDIFGRTDTAESGLGEHKRIAAAELEGKTEDLNPDGRTFITMMVLSTIVATTGLLLNSPAVVVGAMVLAPLFGPATSTSVGTVIDKPDLFRRGVRLQVIGVGCAIIVASGFAWFMKTAYLTPSGFALTTAPQIVQRISPDLLSLVVALVAGIAGVISIATGAGITLVGVMMAAALLPPAATVGIGIAWGEPSVALQSGVLLGVNLLAINFAGLSTLWYLGYRPQSWIQIPRTRRALLRRSGILLIAILVCTAFLWNATYASVQRTQFEHAVEEELSDLLSEPGYANVTLVGISVTQDRGAIAPRSEEITVTIARPPGEDYPGIRREIDDRVESQAGYNVTTNLRVTLVYSEP